MSKIRFIRSLANRIFQPWAVPLGLDLGDVHEALLASLRAVHLDEAAEIHRPCDFALVDAVQLQGLLADTCSRK